MKFIKRSARNQPRISLILLDWSVRESFHVLHYLARQNVDRDLFEIVVIEYYSREAEAIMKFEDQIDCWLLLEMPSRCYYHKHLMYNAGIVVSRGEILVFCDSDAMVKETFIKSILDSFRDDSRSVLHLDQFRNMRRDFYPFNYPSFEEVVGPGCINNVAGKTAGILDTEDPLHTRNYGACMCAKRDDIIRVGGADEHDDYLGHVCGPYDMTFRLVNDGCSESWHQTEFMYHTWHPGQAGQGNYLGPHDGRCMSTTALENIVAARTMPHVENGAIQVLRLGQPYAPQSLEARIIDPERVEAYDRDRVESRWQVAGVWRSAFRAPAFNRYNGFRILGDHAVYSAAPIIYSDVLFPADRARRTVEGPSIQAVVNKIDAMLPLSIRLAVLTGVAFMTSWRFLGDVNKRLRAKLNLKRRADKQVGDSRSPLVRSKLQLMSNFMVESRAMAQILADMIVSLFLMKSDGLLANGSGGVIVVTMRKGTKRYLELLMRLNWLPRVNVRLCRNRSALRALVESCRSDMTFTRIILDYELLVGCRDVVASLDLKNRPLVV
jgi:hypothetical protein